MKNRSQFASSDSAQLVTMSTAPSPPAPLNPPAVKTRSNKTTARIGPAQLFVRRAGKLLGSPIVSHEPQIPIESSRPSVPRVGVLVETQVGPGRDILRGIARYVRESGPWALHLEARPQIFMEGWEPKWMNKWKGQGIIARFDTRSTLGAVKRLGVPAVDV